VTRPFKFAPFLAVLLVAFACPPPTEAGHRVPGRGSACGLNRGYSFDPTLPLRTDPYWSNRYQDRGYPNPYPYPFPQDPGIYVDPWGRVVDRWGRPIYPNDRLNDHRGRVDKHGDYCQGYGFWCDRHKRHHNDRGRCFQRK
jgi:hypothetical protein